MMMTRRSFSISNLTIPTTYPEKSLLCSKEPITSNKANKTNEKGKLLDETTEMGMGKVVMYSSVDFKLVMFAPFSSTIELFPSIFFGDHLIFKPPPCTAHTRPSESKVSLIIGGKNEISTCDCQS